MDTTFMAGLLEEGSCIPGLTSPCEKFLWLPFHFAVGTFLGYGTFRLK
jgi:hypothetical protein